MTSLAVACLCFAGMFGLYTAYDHEAPHQVVALTGQLEALKKNEAFYLELKKRIEAENAELVQVLSDTTQEKDDLFDQLKSSREELSARDYENDSLKSELIKTNAELAKLIELEQVAETIEQVAVINPQEIYVPLVPLEFVQEVRDWTQANSTLAFPCEVEVLNEPVSLSDLTLSASIEIQVGETLVITKFHPVSEIYLVARQGDHDTFMASVHIDNTNVMEVLSEKYVSHMKSIGRDIANPYMRNKFSQVDKNFSEE